ncbi:OmpW family protein [Chelatococcus sp. SYSU_G07232]|uniref:OmpW family protein n=1 Tax=Chelatococcus albus TaxID=3047466 RepID=A0ABT7AMI1_9HYPH|nr:OmpW family protein [Chelatococcus sp. SYSU_G07232]MDJ1159776.1 OmpW family protein [Chelatococcus sp. SYSU_G07232]
MSRLLTALLLSATVLAGAAAGVSAADLPARHAPVAPPPAVDSWSPWMLRVRALGVVPQESSSLELNGTAIAGDKVSINNTVVPELDITYFFTKNIAVELILGTTPHNIRAAGSIAGLGPIGRTWLLPPTLTLQYHFDINERIKPYVGAGVNYTFFYNTKAKGVFSSLDVENSFGFALQAGVDIMLDRHWGVNLDVKKIFLEPDVKATIPGVGLVTGKVKIDPWLIGGGLTYRF